ncbi:MAG: dihydroneopterin aldolase [Rhodospirillaceae bacterium]|nr:dihydroneopterin aldolase [Rhodospirillaceae bacterium]
MTAPIAKIALSRRIRLEDFRLPVSIGIHDFERDAPQIVVVNVELELAANWTDPADRIEHALDYDFLRDGIAALVRGRHFNLQETLCREILDLCLAQKGLARVTVSTRKPDVYPDCRSIGFEIEARIGDA